MATHKVLGSAQAEGLRGRRSIRYEWGWLAKLLVAEPAKEHPVVVPRSRELTEISSSIRIVMRQRGLPVSIRSDRKARTLHVRRKQEVA